MLLQKMKTLSVPGMIIIGNIYSVARKLFGLQRNETTLGKFDFRTPRFSVEHLGFFSSYFHRNFQTNGTSFESPNKRLLETGEKMGLALSLAWPNPLN